MNMNVSCGLLFQGKGTSVVCEGIGLKSSKHLKTFFFSRQGRPPDIQTPDVCLTVGRLANGRVRCTWERFACSLVDFGRAGGTSVL